MCRWVLKETPGDVARYECCVAGEVGLALVAWLGASNFCTTSSGNTLFVLDELDQPALHGILLKIRDCGLTLIYLRRCDMADI